MEGRGKKRFNATEKKGRKGEQTCKGREGEMFGARNRSSRDQGGMMQQARGKCNKLCGGGGVVAERARGGFLDAVGNSTSTPPPSPPSSPRRPLSRSRMEIGGGRGKTGESAFQRCLEKSKTWKGEEKERAKEREKGRQHMITLKTATLCS